MAFSHERTARAAAGAAASVTLALSIAAVIVLGAVASWCVLVAQWCRDYDASLFYE